MMPVLRSVLFVLLLLGLPPTPGPAQPAPESPSPLTDTLRAHRYPIDVQNNRLEGPGGDWLIRHASEASIITLGEMHGTQEIPALMDALFAALQAAGELDHLALEVSPWTARLMTDRLRAGEAAYTRFIQEHPPSIPFYFLARERDLVRRFVENSNEQRPLWGLDQIFAFATGIALDRLAELAPSPDARAAVRRVRAAAQHDSLDGRPLPNLPPTLPTPLMAYPRVAVDTLHPYFSGVPEAQQLLDELATSITIYRTNETDNYRSNQMRARSLRRNLIRAYRRAQPPGADPPQVAIKVGGRHAYRGRTPNNALDVGNLAVALAQETGATALNVAVYCGPNSRARDFPSGTVAGN
jgi:hypothetical protein